MVIQITIGKTSTICIKTLSIQLSIGSRFTTILNQLNSFFQKSVIMKDRFK